MHPYPYLPDLRWTRLLPALESASTSGGPRSVCGRRGLELPRFASSELPGHGRLFRCPSGSGLESLPSMHVPCVQCSPCGAELWFCTKSEILCFMTRLFYMTFSRPNASFPFRRVWFSCLFVLQLGAELVPRGSLPVSATPTFSSFLYVSPVSLVSTPCPSLQPF